MPGTDINVTSRAAPETIADYHAHVYFDPAAGRGRAETLRQRIA